MMRHHRAVFGLLGPVFRSSSGSTLLWMIGALVVLGAVAAGVALMSPSASRGKLEQEAGMRAYYNANAGLQFLNSANDAGESAKLDFSNFTSRMGGTGVVTYTMPDNGTFSYQLGNLNANGVNGTYQIVSLNGAVLDASGNNAYSYTLYGGGKDSSSVKKYVVTTQSVRPSFNSDNISGQIVKVAGKVIGSVLAGSAVISGGTKITGSLIVTSEIEGIDATGGIVIASDNNSIVCSNYGVYINGGSNVINGNIYSPGVGTSVGYVKIAGGSTVNGNIYANGTVTITDGSHIDGEVHSQKDIYLYSGSIGTKSKQGNALSNLTSTFTGGETSYTDINSQQGIDLQNITVNGDLHYKTFLLRDKDSTHWTGEKDNNPTAPTAPESCETYAKPSVPTFTATENFSGVQNKTFTAGDYYFTEFKPDWGSTICFDTSDGDINILVSGDIDVKGSVLIKSPSRKKCSAITIDSDDAIKAAPYIYVYTGGSFTLEGSANWIGTVLAYGDIDPGWANIVGSLHSIAGVVNPKGNYYSIRVVGLHK